MQNMTELYFVRHAEPNYGNHDDQTRELTEKGLRDRALVTAFLEDKHISAVLSSPYKRTVDTVHDFADRNNLAITLIPDFRERRVDSVWIEDFDGFCRRQWADFDYKYTDGETLRSVQKRNISALSDVLRTYAGQHVAIGSHGTALSTIVNYFDPSFGYSDFQSIRSLMPWVVRFVFDGTRCTAITGYDLFTNKTRGYTPQNSL
ncbi:MAG: histidine phosphatase family protein [Hominenteromicrobium sp.]